MYAVTKDAHNGQFIGVVGPFEDEEQAIAYFSNPLLDGISWTLDTMSLSDYLIAYGE